MAKDQQFFTYTNEQLGRIVISLSPERLAPYMLLANNDRFYAIKLYEWNKALSEAFYGVLQGLEVALRNAFHRVMSAGFRREDWYDHCGLDHTELLSITRAKSRIVQAGKTVRPGRVVAELTFGFWVALTGPAYAQPLWDKHLHKAFVAKLGRKAVNGRLDGIRKLRNRVAHHESILSRDLKADYSSIIEAVHWICPVTAAWLKSNNSFHATIQAKPCSQQGKAMAVSIPEEENSN